METFEINFVLIWLCGYLLFVLFALIANLKKQRDKLTGFPLDELTVIVPFRNECYNLENLCDYLGQQNSRPRHVIFVNDHSFDASGVMLEIYLKKKDFSYEILHLDGQQSGKKEAIMTAVRKAKTKYFHTLDADIHFNPDFFESLPDPGENNMLILPVRMTGFQWLTFILELEYGSFQILQAMVADNKPLMASGANLIFNRESYLKYNKLEEHAYRNSGDDQYALAQFLKHKLKVKTFFDLRLAVSTDTPDNLSQLFAQRVRWMGNNTQGKDWRASFFALLIFLFNSSFLGLLVWGVLSLNLLAFFVLLISKMALDYVLYLPWFKRNKTWELQKYLPLLSIFYPLYVLILPLSYLFLGRNLKWKNRNIAR